MKCVQVVKSKVLPKVLIMCDCCKYRTVHCLTKSGDLYLCACGTEIQVKYVEVKDKTSQKERLPQDEQISRDNPNDDEGDK